MRTCTIKDFAIVVFIIAVVIGVGKIAGLGESHEGIVLVIIVIFAWHIVGCRDCRMSIAGFERFNRNTSTGGQIDEGRFGRSSCRRSSF
jgi:hypothetical protein